MAVRPQDEILQNINDDLADNNAGNISAADVRTNLEDAVESMIPIVASGNFNAQPFVGNNVRIGMNADDEYGELIVESGIRFDNGTGTEALIQLTPYLGEEGIIHNNLDGLTIGDPHTQYMNLNGIRKAERNIGMGDNWINSEGASDGLPASYDDHGFQFEKVPSGEIVHLGNKSVIKTDIDGSEMTSAVQVAQAYIRFIGSGDMAVLDSHNVSQLERYDDPGKFKVYFKEGLFDNGNYICIANSNATTDDANPEDFDLNIAAVVERTADYVSFVVRNDNNEYVNAAVNDLVVYGRTSGVLNDESVTILTQ
jgi:hypothetical protein